MDNKNKNIRNIFIPQWMIIIKKIYDNHNSIFDTDFERDFTITELNKSLKGLYSNTYLMVQLFMDQGLLDCNIKPYKKQYRLSSKGEHIGEHVSESLRLLKKYKITR